jgi:hypothetical protein
VPRLECAQRLFQGRFEARRIDHHAREIATPRQPAPQQLAAALATGTPHTFSLRRPATVVLAPWTAWVEPSGKVFFRAGHERADAEIIAGLARRAGAD